MKICLISPLPPFRGGIAKYCYSLAQELEKRHNLLLLSYKRQYPALLYGRKSQIDPEVGSHKISHEFTDVSYAIDSINPFTWHAAVEAIVAFRTELVILPWWVAYWTPMYLYLAAALKKRGIRVVFLCINVFEHENSRLKKLLTEVTLGRADSLIVHSDQEKAEILWFNPTATVRKHLLPLFRYDGKATRRHDGKLHLLFFGFVRPYKGLDLLLRALAILKNRDVSLRIAGEFWTDKGEYLELIKELGIDAQVEIIDRYVPEQEMRRFFEEADVVVLPYRKSKTSGVIATAYGFAKPVLATDVGGFHEVVRDGYSGKIVAPDSPEAIANGIAWFIGNRQTDFAGNIAAFSVKEMSWSSLVDLIEEFN
ncbi:MAG TPA: glycosyltransferase family 4 protein [Geobacteraceae bacterium]|nr:glycosyltransferase family 4 protein [Geobacteraceae bacterium]